MRWNRHYVLDENNRPVEEPDLTTWARWFESNNRRVGYTQINSEVLVSTVFLGIDHGFCSTDDRPVLFETMVFGGKHDEYQHRHHTWDDAKKFHDMVVEELLREHYTRRGATNGNKETNGALPDN